jgi:hypothetical protein
MAKERTSVRMQAQSRSCRSRGTRSAASLGCLSFRAELNARSTFIDEFIKLDEVESELDAQIERARSMSSSYSNDQMAKVVTALNSVWTSLQNARIDEDEKRKAVKCQASP